ncbi:MULTISPECIES: response regulator transcription factor [Streptosporangium]|uniref:DNA-binding response OmpR family regulator n=1 Tax=Streptosporangium brasiliense TaxID=47480 RepID=A0ABT9RI47_9ACTN|nr:DNA-binding response regulator [Streptosporangium brasiliense]MDP9868961.1 DNA-binding response OmpR family regulator [Streptosporangium brasiliense]
MRVLVVEDFEILARSVGTGLRREGMAVDVVLDGTAALDRLAATRYDVVILDRDLLAVPGLVISAEELLERVWDEAADPFSSAVKHTMHRLRAKLGDPPVIETIREGGYRIGSS